jgi:cephalosporin hydroxylase
MTNLFSREALRATRVLGDKRARPNLTWLQSLTGTSYVSLRSTLVEAREFEAQEAAMRATHLRAGRSNYAQTHAPLELYTIVRLLRPKHVVETGVSSGVSSMHLLLGLNRNRYGVLHSIDLPQEQAAPELAADESSVAVPQGKSSGWAIPRRISRRRWDLRLGLCQNLLPTLVKELPQIDLFIHDDLHTPEHLAFELALLRPKLSPGAIILSDDADSTGSTFPKFAQQVGAKLRQRGRTDLVGLRLPGHHLTE